MTVNDTNARWRKLLVPGAASVVGAGAGLALTRTQKLRDALPSLDDVGIGDLAEDLRAKLSSVVGTAQSQVSSATSGTLDSRELETRRRRREERRKQRAGR